MSAVMASAAAPASHHHMLVKVEAVEVLRGSSGILELELHILLLSVEAAVEAVAAVVPVTEVDQAVVLVLGTVQEVLV